MPAGCRRRMMRDRIQLCRDHLRVAAETTPPTTRRSGFSPFAPKSRSPAIPMSVPPFVLATETGKPPELAVRGKSRLVPVAILPRKQDCRRRTHRAAAAAAADPLAPTRRPLRLLSAADVRIDRHLPQIISVGLPFLAAEVAHARGARRGPMRTRQAFCDRCVPSASAREAVRLKAMCHRTPPSRRRALAISWRARCRYRCGRSGVGSGPPRNSSSGGRLREKVGFLPVGRIRDIHHLDLLIPAFILHDFPGRRQVKWRLPE